MQNKIQETILDKFTPQAKNAIMELAKTLTPLLDEIHASSPTTQNYYEDYMNILATRQNKSEQRLLAIALMYAGVNPKGLESASKILDI
jgi:hypothetical protein